MDYALLDDLAHQSRAIVRLTGPDTHRFVQGTITADVGSLPPGRAVAAALCTVKGKLVAELIVLPVDEQTVDLLVPSDCAAAVAESLTQHIIMDDVTLAAPTETCVAVAWDDAAPDDAPQVQGDVRTFVTRHPAPGRLVVGSPTAVRAALAAGVAASADGWAARRIATASPAWGHEIAADVFPPEVGFVHAVSYNKGCFMGQEPLARIHARGQVNRVMVRVQLDAAPGETPPPLLDDEGAEVGRLTTWCAAAVGLAIVRRKVAVAGQRLAAGDLAVEVITGPLGDDPGVGTKQRTAPVKLGGRR